MQTITPTQWIHANRNDLYTLNMYIDNLPDILTIHRGDTLSGCGLHVEPYSPDDHSGSLGLIITDASVTHVGVVDHAGAQTLFSIKFDTTAALVAMSINLTRCFWSTIEPGIAVLLETLTDRIAELNTHPLSELELLSRMPTYVTYVSIPPQHLDNVRSGQTVLTIRKLGGFMWGLEMSTLLAVGRGYRIKTTVTTTKQGVDLLLSDINRCIQKYRRDHAPIPKPEVTHRPTIASLAAKIETTIRNAMMARDIVSITHDAVDSDAVSIELKLTDANCTVKAIKVLEQLLVGYSRDTKLGYTVTVTTNQTKIVVNIALTTIVVYL